MWGCVSNCCLLNGSVCFGSVSPWDERFYCKSLTFMNSGGRAMPSSYDSATWEMEQPLCKKVVLIKMTNFSTPARVKTKVNCTKLHCNLSLSGNRWHQTPQTSWILKQQAQGVFPFFIRFFTHTLIRLPEQPIRVTSLPQRAASDSMCWICQKASRAFHQDV